MSLPSSALSAHTNFTCSLAFLSYPRKESERFELCLWDRPRPQALAYWYEMTGLVAAAWERNLAQLSQEIGCRTSAVVGFWSAGLRSGETENFIQTPALDACTPSQLAVLAWKPRECGFWSHPCILCKVYAYISSFICDLYAYKQVGTQFPNPQSLTKKKKSPYQISPSPILGTYWFPILNLTAKQMVEKLQSHEFPENRTLVYLTSWGKN